MAKKPLKPLGSGKVEGSASSGSEKWISAAAVTDGDAEHFGQENTQYLPMELIDVDADNPRSLAITPDGIAAQMERYPLPSSGEGSGQESWVEQSCKAFTGDAKAREDLESILLFAVSLEDAKRLLNPITVLREGERFKLLAGERRYLSHIVLGSPTILARVLSQAPSPLEKARLQWEENENSLALSPGKKIKNLSALLSSWQVEFPDQSISVNKFADLTGMKRSVAQRYLAILRCDDPSLNQAIDEGKVAIMQASKLAALNKKQRRVALQGAAPNPPPPFPKLTVGPGQDFSSIAFIITAAAEKAKDKEVTAALADLDLSNRAHLHKALDLLIRRIGEML